MNTTTCRSFPRALSPGGYLNALLPNSARYSSRTAIVKTGKSTCAAFFAVAATPGNHNETYDDDGQIEAVIAAATITLRANYTGQRRADPQPQMRNTALDCGCLRRTSIRCRAHGRK
jgi:hypothetical protein